MRNSKERSEKSRRPSDRESSSNASDRYFIIEPGEERRGSVLLGGSEFHHCVKVGRARVGDVVKLIDGRGGTYTARIARIGRRDASLDVISFSREASPPPVDLAIGIVKAPRFDLAVEKCTELGVRRLIPFMAARSVWRGGEGASDLKVERIRRKIAASCKQSGRALFPEIERIESFEGLVGLARGYAAVFVADQHSVGSPAGLEGLGDAPVLGVVGPEGGLSGGEMELLLSGGAKPLSLGPLRLRTETAAICLACRLMARRRGEV